jgi:hypothetical protein
LVIPPGSQRCYAEKVVYLPDTVTGGSRRVDPQRPGRAAGLRENGFASRSFSASDKITSIMFDAFMQLVAAREGSVLWLIGANPAVESQLAPGGRAPSDRGGQTGVLRRGFPVRNIWRDIGSLNCSWTPFRPTRAPPPTMRWR